MNTLSKTDIYGYVSQLCDSLKGTIKSIVSECTKQTSLVLSLKTEQTYQTMHRSNFAISKMELKSYEICLLRGSQVFQGSSKYFRNGEYRDASVHAFINKETGEVFKPAGYNKPARGVRYDLTNERHRNFLFQSKNVDWAGGYLYIR